MTATAMLHNTAQYVTLGIDQDVFAVPVETVREILDMRPISWLPNAPSFMLGMIDVRGVSVPVIDLRNKLGLPGIPPTENTRILVLDITLGEKASLLGLVADQVFEVTPLADREPPPELGIRWRSDYITAISRRNGKFVIIFNLAHLLTGEELALVPATGESHDVERDQRGG